MRAAIPGNGDMHEQSTHVPGSLDGSTFQAILNLLVQVTSIACDLSMMFIESARAELNVYKAGVALDEFSLTPADLEFLIQLSMGSTGSGLTEISDTANDGCFHQHSFSFGNEPIRFYAGIPLYLEGGVCLGTLCILDRRPYTLSRKQASSFVSLAQMICYLYGNMPGLSSLQTMEERSISSGKKNGAVRLVGEPAIRSVDPDVETPLPMPGGEGRGSQWGKIVDALQISTWVIDVVKQRVLVNELWSATIMPAPEKSTPALLEWFELFHPDDRARCTQAYSRFISGQIRHYETEARVRGRAGEWLWLSSKGWVLEADEFGQPLSLLITHHDVSERKKQADTLSRNQAFLDRTSRLAGVGGWEVDFVSGQVTWCNETRRIYGVDRNYPPSADHYIQFCAPEARPALQAAVDVALQGGAGFDLELPFIRLDGRRIWVRAVGTAELADGVAVRLVGSFQDVSDRVLERQALAEAIERATLATNSGGIGIWDWDIPTDVLRWDAWMYRLYDLERDESGVGISLWMRCVHPEDFPTLDLAIQTALAGGPSVDVEFRVLWPDGSPRYLHSTGVVKYDEMGRPVRMVGTNRDVTSARRLATELSEQHEMLRVTLMSIGDAVITTDARGHVAWLNPVAENLTGWLSAEAAGQPLSTVFSIVHQQTRIIAEDPVAQCLRKKGAARLSGQNLLISRTGEEYGVEDSAAPIRNEHGDVLGAVLVFHDVTEQRRLSSELSYRASHDSLTGLVNRAEFEVRLGRALRRSQESGAEHTLLYIDLDQFKLVNDACGHAVGDNLLQQVSKLLGTCVRERDTLARLGGDEFGIILEHCSAEQALRVAESICERMEKFRFLSDGRRFRIGTSIGLVPVDARWSTTLALQQAADTSCYAAKEAGRNRVHAWFESDRAMHVRHGEMQWTMRIEQALDEGRFLLYAQRIAPLNQASKGLHAEVLLRMLDSEGALIQPGAFLPAAERFHLASRIDRWVLTNTIEWMQSLPLNADVENLSINLSGQSVGDRAFHRWTLDVLSHAGHLICSRLCFEVTETSAVTNFADAALFIEQIRAVGVRVALDDFGAGASSFGYLKTLSVDYLKIDGQFVKNVVTDPLDDAAVRCFINVASVLGVKTVAEYVDNLTVQDHLRSLGVDFVQGFLLHRPSPINDLLGFQSRVG